MRHLKMFGLAAVAAVAAMAFVGASSAMATGESALCNNTSVPCNSVYTGHVEATAENTAGTPLLLTTNILSVICAKSDLLGNALGLAAPEVVHLELLDWLTCNAENKAKTPCTVTTTSLGLLLLLNEGGDTGSIQSHGTNVLVECGSLIHCVYGGLPTVTGKGGAPAVIKTNNVALEKIEGFLCPATSNWEGTYSIVLPNPIHISS